MCVTSHSITFCVSEKNNEKKIILNYFFHYALLTLFMLKLNYKSNKGTKYVLADLCEELKKCALIFLFATKKRYNNEIKSYGQTKFQ